MASTFTSRRNNGRDFSSTTIEGVNIQSSSNANQPKSIPLSKWLQLQKQRIKEANGNHNGNENPPPQQVAEDATLKKWLETLQQQQPRHTHQRQRQQIMSEQQQRKQQIQQQDLQQRLRVAIAITKALNDTHESSDRGEGDCHCGQLSLENIILDIAADDDNDDDDEYLSVVATLSLVGIEKNVIPLEDERSSEEDDMTCLGHILNSVLDGDNIVSMRMKIKQEDEDEDEDEEEENNGNHHRTNKKRGKGQQTVVENLPLYLTCLISALISTPSSGSSVVTSSKGAAVAAGSKKYESVKQVLLDLQMAYQKPEVYLRSNSWDDVKNDRLQIPRDSFYGRKSEVALALHSLDAVMKFGQPVMVLVSGYAGTGKTALLNQIRKPLMEAGGMMIKGKFDKAVSPNTVIFSAFDSFFADINNNGDASLQAELKLRINESVGRGAVVLMSVIPNLRALMEDDDCNEEDEFNIAETVVSHQRWKYLVVKLMKSISDKSRPVAFFMDDLHWCDDVTLDMIQMIVMDLDIRYCLFLGSYRINAHEAGVTKMLNSIQAHGVRLVSLKVSCIEKESVNALISEALCIPPSLCQSLSTIVHSKTGGYILFATNFLKSLHEESMIRFNLNTRKWEYNINDIRQKNIPADVVQHLSERMARLPNNVQSILKIAACLGFEFDADLLQMAIKGKKESRKYTQLLSYAIESGFLQEIPDSNKFVWAHDQIHLAAYELISLNKRQSSHLLIGSRIYMNTSSDDILYEVIFDICNNMNFGLELITSRAQKTDVAQLNLTAGKKAMASSSFDSAAQYFMVGIGLLGEECWECNYKLSLTLHQAASEALFVAGDLETLKHVIDKQLTHASCLDDKLQCYDCLVRYLFSSSNAQEAVEQTMAILSELGESFPEVTPELIYRELMSTKALLNNMTKDDIEKSPKLTNERELWKMKFMWWLLKFLFSTRPIAMPLVACRMITISTEHGYCSDSAMGLAVFSLSQWNFSQDIEEAYKWAKIACFASIASGAYVPKLTCLFHSFTSFWREPIQATSDALLKVHHDLLMVGDVEFAIIALFNHCRQSLLSGKDMASLKIVCASVTSKMAQLTQIQSYMSHSSHILVILKLSGNAMAKNPFDTFSGVFNGAIKNEDDLLQHCLSKGKSGVVQAIYFNRLFSAYWFKRYDEAAQMAELYKSQTVMPLIDTYHAFYQGLTAIHFVRHRPNEPKWREIAEKALASFKSWVTYSTWNWENKLLLLEAEWHFSKKEMEMADDKYKAAIESARKHRFVHEEGLANELFSVFHATKDNDEKARVYILEARTCYVKWGAFALVKLLDSYDAFIQ